MGQVNNASKHSRSVCEAMTAPATRSHGLTKHAPGWARIVCAGLLGAAMVPVAAHAQVQQDEPDIKDVARTPLTDLGFGADDIPEVLIKAESNPYESESLTSCNAIVAGVAEIDQVLGADYDIADASDTGLSKGRAAQSVVGSFIPFRGVVREVSGAAGDERKLRAAVMAGMVRRGFLKGLGLERGCKYPARPKPE